MAARKTERMMNLVIALLVSRSYLPKDRIRHVVEGYRGQSDEAFDRMFERDKEELRDIGVTIDVGSFDKGFGDELGYRILRDQFELPEISLEPEEAAVVGLAARVWQHQRLAGETSSAVLKLKAAGLPVDAEALTTIEPRLAASEAAFEPLWDAVVTRTPVRFEYRRPGQEATWREVEPWSVLSWHGRWYLVGFDRSRTEPRMFRLNRVVSVVESAGAPGEYDIPDNTDVRAIAESLYPRPATSEATVRVREGRAVALRRRATGCEAVSDGWDELTVPYAEVWQLGAEVCSYGPDVVVTAPTEVRDYVRRHLRHLLDSEVRA